MKRTLSAILLVGCVLVLAACGGLAHPPVTGTDQHRVQVMLDEPIIRHASNVRSHPAKRLTSETWRRGAVSASVFSMYPKDPGDRPVAEVTVRRTAKALGVLRDSGWTIMSALCDTPGSAGPGPASNAWSWKVTAYKHVSGVSYWAHLTAGASSGVGLVDITVRAPSVDDPADLFGDRPPGLPPGSTCIESPGLASADVQQGKPIMVAPVVGPLDSNITKPAR